MSFISGLDFTRNYSLFTTTTKKLKTEQDAAIQVPVAFLLCMLPGAYAARAAGPSFDPANPRQLTTTLLSDDKMEKAHQQRILRARSAMENGFETLGLYAAGVAAANHARVDARLLNLLTLGYLASRAAYVYAYVVLCADRKLAPLRSVCWAAGAAAWAALWVLAGRNVM
ncbi:hypothetical protein J3F83DRAFT_714649 [Trichoderma novae-zelandiae]